MRRFARVLPLGLVAVLLSAPGTTPAAVAAPVQVEMLSHSYSPATAIVGLGGQVRWRNASGLQHTATSNQGFFFSPLLNGNGDTATLTFQHAGSFGYYCEVHGPTMAGTVKVPLRAPTGAASGFTLRWSAVGSNLDGRRFDVQKKAPGTSTWTWLKSNTTTRSVFLNPARNGTWRYRARSENIGNLSNIMASGWSPTKLVRVS
jgi:plastocyanin